MLIAGGRDKGVDLSALPPVVAERAAAAVLIGESGPDLEPAVPRGRASTDRASRGPRGRRSAAPTPWPGRRSTARPAGPAAGPATVLLSPAAASFDMFLDYAARGRAFKEAVADLAAGPSAGGDR